MKSIKKIILSTLLLTSLVPATQTRLAAIGNLQYLYDDNNIFFNPSLINKYQNSLFLELGDYAVGSPTNQYAGLLVGTWGINLGIVLKRQNELENMVFSSSYAPGAMPKNPIQLFFSLGTGKIGLGASLYYADSKDYDGSTQEDNATGLIRNVNDTLSSHNVGLQVGTNLVVGPVNLDAWAGAYNHAWQDIGDEFEKSTTTTSRETSENYLSNSISIPLGARLSLSLGETTKLITGATYSVTMLNLNSKDSTFYASNNVTLVDTSINTLDKYTIQSAGAFGIIETGYGKDKGKVYAGLQLALSHTSLDKIPPAGIERNYTYSNSSKTYYYFPILQFGMEHNLFKWWQMRAGMQYSRISTSEKRNYTGYEYNSYMNISTNSGSFITLGSKFEFGRLSLDAFMSESLLFEGLNIITGRISTDPLFGKISLSYRFNAEKTEPVVE